MQNEYNPFASRRVRGLEEFGDVMAEGLFALLDDGRTIKDADEQYWREFIRHRRAVDQWMSPG